MKKYLLCLFALIFNLFTFAQSKSVITINVHCDSLPQNSHIFISGNDIQLGNWQPDSAKLIKTEENIWTGKFSFEKGKKLEFKITRGSWDNEALNDDGSVPENHSLIVESDTTISIFIHLWADKIEKRVEGQVTGIIKYHLNFKGEKIKPRNIIVWLPPFYFLNPEKRYPVLYMQDGQNLFDPKTSTFNIDWQIDENADSLIRKGLIEEIIIVGIYNSVDRSGEYSDSDTGFAYMNFIVNTLKPFIDQNYRTKPDRKNTAVGGSSLGGLISFILLWEYPEVFYNAACISPAFKIERFNYVDNVERFKDLKKDIRIYIDNGDDDIDSGLQKGVDEILFQLKRLGYVEGNDLYWFKDEKSGHSERSWAKRIWRAMIFMFGTERGRGLL
jgi:predicted alpha/beta superfamily hydrolase